MLRSGRRSGDNMAVSGVISIACYLRPVRDRRSHPISGAQTLRVGPRFASPIARRKRLARSSRSLGARKPRRRAPCGATREQPQQAVFLMRLAVEAVQTGSSEHRESCRRLTFFARSSEGVTVTPS